MSWHARRLATEPRLDICCFMFFVLFFSLEISSSVDTVAALCSLG
jgi:hypothetical protein